ncbi:MAG: hypothetical protein VX044_06590, partial [Planctomycetota bacterium]|nr:hypothetical protein [Planctomycetota bacterium]
MVRSAHWLAWICFLAASVGLTAQAPRFTRRARPAPSPGLTAVALGDVVVSVRDGALWVAGGARLDGATPRPAACTAPSGTGRVYVVTSTGLGQCVVGAEHGLFVLDEDHPWADPVTVRDGMPSGAVRGLASMGDGRLFVCTESHFGCVDLRHRFGFVFGVEQGLPPAPYAGLAWDGEHLVLQASDGDFAYLPGSFPPPQPAGDGAERGARTVAFEEPLLVAPTVSSLGAVQLRARRRHHHLLTPLPDGMICGLAPGRHVVEVYAVDQELRRCKVGEYDVDVPLPARFSRRWLAAGAGIAGVLLAVLAWPKRGRRRGARAALRVGVVAVLSLQLLAALLGYGRSWPFVGFSMYTETYREGSTLYKPQVLGLREDGTEVPLIDWDLGLRQDGYWHVLSELVYGDDALLDKHLKILAERRPRYAVTG